MNAENSILANAQGTPRLVTDHGWTCYHCGEKFTTPGGARDHFGATPDADPGCCIKVLLGGERGLLMALREAESSLAKYMDDDAPVQQEMRAMQSRHADALMSANEAGYSSGLRSGRVNADADIRDKVAAAVAEEREACAALCVEQAERLDGPSDAKGIAYQLAGTIRARSN